MAPPWGSPDLVINQCFLLEDGSELGWIFTGGGDVSLVLDGVASLPRCETFVGG